MMMREKFDRAVADQSVTAQKVFAAVPLNEPWTSHAVFTEMKRQQNGGGPQFSVVEDCLNRLTKEGLVKEGPPGMFRRAPVREPDPVREAPASNEPAPSAARAERSPLDNMAHVASSLRALGEQLNAQLHQAAREVEDAALSMQDGMDMVRKETEKLGQLRDLLKSIGGA